MSVDIFPFLESQNLTVNQAAVEKGQIICQEGQTCSDLVVLTSGEVRVYKPSVDGRTISLYHIVEGESCILTAGCILNQTLFPAIAETQTAVTGIAISSNLVKQWMNDHEIWRNYIFSTLNQRFADVIELANSLAFEQLESRIITWIIRNHGANEISTTHQQIAEELGTSREVVSRKLKSLEHKQLISLSRGKLNILNRDLLTELMQSAS